MRMEALPADAAPDLRGIAGEDTRLGEVAVCR